VIDSALDRYANDCVFEPAERTPRTKFRIFVSAVEFDADVS